MSRSSARSTVSEPNRPRDPSEVIARAERYARTNALQFTSMRRRVLAEIAGAQVPLTAYALADRVSTDKRVAPAQIYRALEFLLEAGVIHRIATQGAFIVCDHEHENGTVAMFLVCDQCGTVTETTSPLVVRGVRVAAAAKGFEPGSQVVEVAGRCISCQQRP